MSERRVRWDEAIPMIGQVLDNFPHDGYSTVVAVDDDPDAVHTLAQRDVPDEWHPKTYIVTLRDATPEEIAHELELAAQLEAQHAEKRKRWGWI